MYISYSFIITFLDTSETNAETRNLNTYVHVQKETVSRVSEINLYGMLYTIMIKK